MIKATENIDTMWELLEEQREELATHKDLMVLKPDMETYRALEGLGKLLSLGVYVDGELVGYSVNILNRSSHYSDLLVCNNDVVFVSKPFRGGLGQILLAYTEGAAKAHGADVMLWHAKPNTALEHILPTVGYGVQDIIFSKVL